MKYVVVIVLVCLCAVALFVAITQKSKISNRVSVSEAEKLVNTGHQAQNGKGYCYVKLKEVTTPEVWDRLHAQVFETRDDTGEGTVRLLGQSSILVKDRQVYPMGSSPTGPENLQLLVFDIDGDSKDELLYAYEWYKLGPSGSQAAGYRFEGPKPKKIHEGFQVCQGHLTLKTRGEHAVEAYNSDRILGELVIARQSKDEVLDVKLDPNLPKKLKDMVCRMPPRKK